jgi:hypothetical protein
MSFPRPFCLVRPALIAIASELVQRRAQQVDRCGAYAVADGDWCAALNVVASHGSRSQRVQRARWRVEWRVGLVLQSVLRPLTAPPLPIA